METALAGIASPGSSRAGSGMGRRRDGNDGAQRHRSSKQSFRRRGDLPQQIFAPARISGQPGAAPSRRGEWPGRRAPRFRPRQGDQNRVRHSLRDCRREHAWRSGKLRAGCAPAPVRAAAQSQNNFAYGPLPVFELHSGFWINLHHTLYHEARQRTAAASLNKSAGPALHTVPDAKPVLPPAEQPIWDEAVAYYVSNYAAKDLLFSSELIQLKDQLGDFEDCDELSGRKRKFCDAGLPAKLTQVLEAAAPV